MKVREVNKNGADTVRSFSVEIEDILKNEK